MSINGLTPKQSELIAQWDAVYEGSAQALTWIEDVRHTAPSVAIEADSLSVELYQARNLARNLKRVTSTPTTVGFFGLSQAGKSFLISALAADQDGELETCIADNKYLNFIDHFNPTGSGAEATGLVTRFTYQKQPIPDAAYPLRLRLLREVEVAMILANAWFKDFDQNRFPDQISEKIVQSTLEPYKDFDLRTATAIPGVTSEDVVALLDYMKDLLGNSASKLNAAYWPRVIKIAPYLSIAQRAQVFSVLWGQQTLFSQAYMSLAQALQQLGCVEEIYVPISVLGQENAKGEFGQHKNIMDVSTLSKLFTASDEGVTVRPISNDQKLGAPTSIQRAELTALAVEMIFPLAKAPKDKVVEDVDLLDFPGYRSRSEFISMDDAKPANADDGAVSGLFLRGKVAYLFQRYISQQEMSGLVMCTSADKQSEVVGVDLVLTQWIKQSQGKTAAERQGRCGLIWALTKFDLSIADALAIRLDSGVQQHWDNVLRFTIMERFGNQSWIQKWDTQGGFKNVFLVRKPRYNSAFLEHDEVGNELRLQQTTLAKMNKIREVFIATEAVQTYIAQPDEAWDAMLGENDGGISRFSSSFAKIADINIKLTRIEDELQKWHDKLYDSLKGWHHEGGNAALEEQQVQAQLIEDTICAHYGPLGELMHYMKAPDDVLRSLYLSGVYEVDTEMEKGTQAAADTSAQPPRPSLYAKSGGGRRAARASRDADGLVAVKEGSIERRFAKAAMSAWFEYLRQLPQRSQLLSNLGLEGKGVAALVKEIITASYRCKLEDKLTQALLVYQTTVTDRAKHVEKQVLTLQMIFQDHVAWLGNLYLPAAQRAPRSEDESTVFDFYDQEISVGLPQLPEIAEPLLELSQNYFDDWCDAIHAATIDNAGHREGSEITLDQNAALGLVLDSFKAAEL